MDYLNSLLRAQGHLQASGRAGTGLRVSGESQSISASSSKGSGVHRLRVPPSWQDRTSHQAHRSEGCWGTGLGCYHTSGGDQAPLRKPQVYEGLGHRPSPRGWAEPRGGGCVGQSLRPRVTWARCLFWQKNLAKRLSWDER